MKSAKSCSSRHPCGRNTTTARRARRRPRIQPAHVGGEGHRPESGRRGNRARAEPLPEHVPSIDISTEPGKGLKRRVVGIAAWGMVAVVQNENRRERLLAGHDIGQQLLESITASYPEAEVDQARMNQPLRLPRVRDTPTAADSERNGDASRRSVTHVATGKENTGVNNVFATCCSRYGISHSEHSRTSH